MNRRELLGLGVKLGVLASTTVLPIQEALAASPSRYAAAFALLDRYVEQYLRDMNAPGLTLALADDSGIQRVCTYGMEDLKRRIPLNPDRLFHIGSISKSFLGLCLVQLQDEGKLDFHKPIRDYLPWLRFDDANTPDAKPITTHHLLTHGGALPDGALFPSDPSFRHRATAAPGTFFHYCNMGYEALGLLLAHLDGGSAADYAGRFTANDGRVLDFAAQGERLFLLRGTERIAVELLAPDVFTVAHADFAHFPLVFTRTGKEGKGAVVEAAWGDDWYAGAAYTGPRSFQLPAAWQQYTGEYRTEDPWLGSARISARQGKLWMNGTIPLEASGDGRFFLRDEPDSPEWVTFREPVNGKACAMVYSGMFLLRA